MLSDRKERLELVTKRLQEELLVQDGFFKSCCELSLGISQDSLRYLDYGICREELGHKDGVYLCIFYAQLYATCMMLHEAKNKISQEVYDEYLCINREMLSQILLMSRQKDTPEELRDALYWFYSDYCELSVHMQFLMIESDINLQFGGPSLLSPSSCWKNAGWSQHTWDCGLYFGKRFEERFLQAVKKESEKNVQIYKSFLCLFPSEAHSKDGFLLTLWQKKQWKQMNTQLCQMAKL